jgi:hypothetical protein
VAHIFKDIFTGKDHAFPSDTKTDFSAYLRFTVSWYGWRFILETRDFHIVLLPYYDRVITRSGATSLDITSEQFDKFYSKRLRLLQPRPRADTIYDSSIVTLP